MKLNFLLLLAASSQALVLNADPAATATPAPKEAPKAVEKAEANANSTKDLAGKATRENRSYGFELGTDEVKTIDKSRPEPPYIVDSNRNPPRDPRLPEQKRIYNPITEKKVEEARAIRINNAYVRAQA